jgi:hypothetical protein
VHERVKEPLTAPKHVLGLSSRALTQCQRRRKPPHLRFSCDPYERACAQALRLTGPALMTCSAQVANALCHPFRALSGLDLERLGCSAHRFYGHR